MEHLYTKSRKCKKEYRKLFGKLFKKGIHWQGWTEKKRLSKLLANKKVMGLLLDFLKITAVSIREKAKKQKLK